MKVSRVVLGLSGKLPLPSRVQGQTQITGGKSFSFDDEYRKPAQMGVGLEAFVGRWNPFVDLSYELWENGDLEKVGMLGELQSMDYYNVWNVVVGSGYRLQRSHRVSAAFGYYPSHVGDGILAKHSDSGQELQGMSFQEFDGVERKVMALGYDWRTAASHYSFGLAHHRGDRSVPYYANGYGDYSLRVNFLTVGMRL